MSCSRRLVPTSLGSAAWRPLYPRWGYALTTESAGENSFGKNADRQEPSRQGLRMAAQSVHRSESYLGNYYRRMRMRPGTPKAITAAAHKLARVIDHLITTRQSYEESVFARCESLHQQRLENRIRRQARLDPLLPRASQARSNGWAKTRGNPSTRAETNAVCVRTRPNIRTPPIQPIQQPARLATGAGSIGAG